VKARQRHRANDHSLRLKRDITRWRGRNSGTLVVTTVAEREAERQAAEEAERKAAACCRACGRRWQSRPPLSGLCNSCRASIDCLSLQFPKLDDEALVAELVSQLAQFA
jgi:hypothetical protein